MKKILITLIYIANYFFATAQIFHENFETPDSVVATSNNPGSNWGLNNRLQSNGTFSDSASLTNCDTIMLTTASFSTLGYTNVVLTFKHICKVHFFDIARVEASPDGGNTWIQLCSEYLGVAPFPTQGCTFSAASYGDWFPSNSALLPENTWWKHEIFDLSGLLYNLPDVQIRFVVIDQFCDLINAEGGWFIDDIKVTDSYFFYYSITGKLFSDLNSNQIRDAGEPAITNFPVTEMTGMNTVFSKADGSYSMNIADTGNGNFTVFPQSLNYYTVVPGSSNAYISAGNPVDSLHDFAFQPAGTFNDLCITITPTSPFRANMNTSYRINYQNIGTTTLNGTVIFFPDNDITFVSAIAAPTSVTTDSVVWNVGTLTPFQSGSIFVTVHVNGGTSVGTLINSSVIIEPVAGDANTVCNYNAYDAFVIASCDPNEILVDRDAVLTTELLSPPYLNYIVYFQNTGNDTAFNVRIRNIIPQNLDMSSFEFITSSHPLVLNYNSDSRTMDFEFNTILLPDSNVNEPGSHGFVRYRIKPLSTLIAGDSIKNNAAIYFDFNPPVMTNTAVTGIVLPSGIGYQPSVTGHWSLYPSPAQQSITLSSSLITNDPCQITIYDLFGREIYHSTMSNQRSTIKIDVSGFSKGIYFAEITSAEKLYRAKFVKE